MRSEAASVQAYLDDLDPERRDVMAQIVATIRENVPTGYDEVMAWGMPTWEVPLTTQPDTYNGKPLAYVSAAAQKRHYAVYLMGLYADTPAYADFAQRWSPPSGKKLDRGKSCVRFTKVDDVDLPLIGEAIAAVPVDAFVANYTSVR